MNRRDFIKNTTLLVIVKIKRSKFYAWVRVEMGQGVGFMRQDVRLWWLKKGKIVAIKGDLVVLVNHEFNCIKGYFSARIMYGEDCYFYYGMNDRGEFDK